MKKIVYLLTILVLGVSCGSEGGSKDEATAAGTDTVKVPTCGVSFSTSDSLATIAIKANKARVECKLTEEEVIKLL
jgi:hypothetical protein